MRDQGAKQLAAILLLFLLCSLPRAAAGKGVEFGYKLLDKVQEGTDPGIVISPSTTAVGVSLSLKRSDGKVFHFEVPRLPAQEQREFHWPQPPGRMRYQAALVSSTTRGEQVTSRFEFEVLVVRPLQVRVLADELDLQRRLIAFTADRPPVRVELELSGADGLLTKQEQAVSGGAGEPVRLQWPEVASTVQKIQMRVFDRDGFWTGAVFEPWWIELPHEELNFDTGKATFRPGEEAKLDRTMKEIGEVLKLHGKEADLRLYVTGYTDTVGTAESNQTLSLERALAIARGFRAKGLEIPIYYQGFGESVLAVPTADEVDEAANRRALYVLGNAPPQRSAAIPRSDWRRL